MIHWFKRHPKHLAAESTALSNDNNYKELFQVRGNLFLSHGNILVRFERIYRFPILIVYPESTPYELPLIYPLHSQLTREIVEQLANFSIDHFLNEVKRYVKFHYHLRHQNETGNLCILEWDNLDDGSKFYGIPTIIKRVRDWCSGLITGKFPPDSQEVEFCSHFNKIDYNYKLFYPEKFLDEDFVEGEAYGTLLQSRSNNRTYFGCLMIAKNRGGLYDTKDYTLPNFFFDQGIKDAFELSTKKDTIKKLVAEGRLLKTYWFQIQNEPQPFSEIKELIFIIGEGDYNAGLKRMMPFYLEDLKLKPDYFFISIRFPNRKGHLEFQLFKVSKGQEATGMLIGASDDDTFRHLLESYQFVSAIPCEKFTEETYHQRNTGRADRNHLKKIVVNVIGVGALGSEIADILGKAGAGTICLFDNQVMRGPNPVRHLAGLDSIGMAKVSAVKSIISDHNPFINIHVSGRNINSIDVNSFLHDGSVSICSMADDNTEGYLNERAVIGDKAVYYVRALRGGKVARIFRVIPGQDACFNCLDLYRKEQKEFINIPPDEKLPTLKNECNNPIRPASAADLKLISSLATRLLLDELQNGFGQSNHWIWSTESLENVEAYKLISQKIPPHPNCYYCNHEKIIKVYLPFDQLKTMQALIAENPKIETGGVLAGKVNAEGNYEITHASEPGPKAIKSSTKFEKDVEYCQKFLDDLFISSNKEIVYLGEWHSHPNRNNQPSGTDINSLTNIAFQKEYLTDMPAMIIFTNTGEPSCTIHPAGKRFYYADLTFTNT